MNQTNDLPNKLSLSYTWQEFTREHISQHEVRISYRDVASVAFADQAGEFFARHVTNKLDPGVAWHGRFRGSHQKESIKESAFRVGPRREFLRF